MRQGNNHASAAWLRIVALGAAIALLASITVLDWRSSQEAATEAVWVDHSHQVIDVLDEMLEQLTAMQTGHRGYALTHEKDFLQPFLEATNKMPGLVSSLRELTRDDPVEREQLNRLEPLVARHIEINLSQIEALVKGDPNAPDLVFRRTLKQSLDNVSAAIGEMVSQENRLLGQRRNALKRTTRIVQLVNVGSTLASAALILGVFAALWRENARRRQVEAELRQAQDELEERVRLRTASLRESEGRFHSLVEQTMDGIFVSDARGNYIDVNTAGCEMLGYSREELLTLNIANVIMPGEIARLAPEVARFADGEVMTSEWLFRRKNGSSFSGEVRGRRLPDGRLQAILRDVTERKQTERKILEAGESEMQRIGRDLHDGVGQQLTALSLYTNNLQQDVQAQVPQLAGPFKKILNELREIIRQIRVLSHGLSPVSLEDNGLVETLRKLADDTRSAAKIDCQFEDSTSTTINDPHLAAQLYRIAQEAVTNALKHSGARKIHIALQASPTRLELKVSDDGRGFSPTVSKSAGLGLRAMKYRADLIGAALQIDSAPGKGTQITCTIHK
jgi:PAS domain S-box-containing protein